VQHVTDEWWGTVAGEENLNKIVSTLVALLSLALIPVLWMFGAQALPSVGTLESTGQGNTIGPLMFTWALIVLASFAAVLVAWLCYVSADRRSDSGARRLGKV
jgi:hypothetical protein